MNTWLKFPLDRNLWWNGWWEILATCLMIVMGAVVAFLVFHFANWLAVRTKKAFKQYQWLRKTRGLPEVIVWSAGWNAGITSKREYEAALRTARRNGTWKKSEPLFVPGLRVFGRVDKVQVDGKQVDAIDRRAVGSMEELEELYRHCRVYRLPMWLPHPWFEHRGEWQTKVPAPVALEQIYAELGVNARPSRPSCKLSLYLTGH